MTKRRPRRPGCCPPPMSIQRFDQLFATFITRMSLAAHDQLKWVRTSQTLEPLQVIEQKVGTLVRRHAASKSKNRQMLVEDRSIERSHARNKHALGCQVSFPQRLIGHLIDANQKFRLVAPAGQQTIVDLREALTGPRRRVHAIGDRMNTMAGKGTL